MKKLGSRIALAAIAIILWSASALGQTTSTAQMLSQFEKNVTVKKLPNGLTAVVCRRAEAPVFSFFTFVDAAAAQDKDGASGLAHMMEHMAFKGTPVIGTKNWPAEKVALEKIEKAYAAYIREHDKRVGQDPEKLKTLEKAWMDARTEADKYVEANEFSKILDQNGEVGMNAFTAEDETGYFYSLPVNRLELWAYMESERLLHPVMREFYKERDVVMEERRMRTDSQPVGRLVEQFLASAFIAHPYHREPIGWMSDLQHISATEAEAFFHTYYIPSNMTITVVGDVTPEQVFPVIERYFGRIPSTPKPDEHETVEPPQTSERRVILREQAQPFYLEGYHRPDYRDPDDNVYDVLSSILSDGRTSRLYRSLVRDQKIALAAAGFGGFPGTKYPQLFSFYAVATSGHTPQELGDSIHKEIERLKSEDVTDDELKSVKTRAKASLIRSLGSNDGLAQNLATYQARFGDWRELFRQIDKIDKVSKADLRRVANAIFTDKNRTVAILETATPPKPAAGPPGAAPPKSDDNKGGAQ
jgi:predicted Zn-dependent peptidase